MRHLTRLRFSPVQERLKAKRKRKKKYTLDVPEVTRERVEELSRRAEPNQPKIRPLTLKSGTMDPQERHVLLSAFDSIKVPTSPGVYLLWLEEQLVYVGGSIKGICGGSIPMYARPYRSSNALTKRFDKISFIPITDLVGALSFLGTHDHWGLDDQSRREQIEACIKVCVGALVRKFRPLHNMNARNIPKTVSAELDEVDREVLKLLGLGEPEPLMHVQV